MCAVTQRSPPLSGTEVRRAGQLGPLLGVSEGQVQVSAGLGPPLDARRVHVPAAEVVGKIQFCAVRGLRSSSL